MKHDMTRHIMNKIARAKEGLRHTLSILFEYTWSMARVWLEYAWSMPRVWVEYASTLLSGGQKLCADEITSRPLRDYVSLPTRLRFVVSLLLLMVLGVGEMWGQDYSGTYYIRSESLNKNTDGVYYMCPTRGWYLYKATDSYEDDTDNDDDNGKPFLTTYQCKTNSYDDVSKAVWTIVKHSSEANCYYIIQKKTGRYMVSNGKIGTSDYRMRVHLESVANETALTSLGNLALFEITSHDGHLDIVPHSSEGRAGDDYRWLVVNFKNFNELKGSAGKTGGPNNSNTAGIIGLYNQEENHKWALELPEPSYYLNVNEDELSVVGVDNLAFYYTTGGETPEVSEDGTPGTSTTKYTRPISLAGVNSIKYIITSKDGKTIKSSVITYYKNSSVEWEEMGFVYNGTAQVPTVSSITINEESKTVSDFTIGAKNNVNAGTAILTLWDETNGIYTSKEFTIDRAEVTVKADDQAKVYQETPSADPTLTATITGLVNNEPESLINYTISREEGDEAGLYTITPTGDAVQGNYKVTYETGVFQIGQEMTPAPTVSLANLTYGSPIEPSVSGNASGGAVTYYYKVKDAGDETYTEEAPVNVGNYTVKAEIARTNVYLPATATKDFKITKASLAVVADAITKDYLDEDPELTYTVSGIQYGEDRNTILACELQREEGEAKGQYAITSKSLSLLSNKNYNAPSFTGAMFTITAKALGDPVTFEPAPKISIYAKENGNNSWTVSVYTGKTAFVEGTDHDYTSEVTGPDDDGNYTVTVTAVEGSNCTGAAKATYSSTIFYAIDGTTEKFIPYISTTSDLTTSSDLVPYIVTQVNSSIGTVSIVPISYIPQDEPVLILTKSDADATGITTSPKNPATFPISESLISSNKLNIAPDEPSNPDDPTSAHGVHVEATEVYMFYKGEFVLTTAGTIKPGNYYVYNPRYYAPTDPGTPSPAPARRLAIVKDDATGIIQLTNDEVKEGLNDVWYSIDGQKISKKPTRKGIYIQNGKKQIVK